MRNCELPSGRAALHELLASVRAYKDRLNVRHVAYLDRVPRFRQRVRYHEERGEHEAIVAAHMEMVAWDEWYQAHKADDPDFALISAFVDWPASWSGTAPDPDRPWLFRPDGHETISAWLTAAQREAVECGLSQEEPLLNLMRGLEKEIIDALDKTSEEQAANRWLRCRVAKLSEVTGDPTRKPEQAIKAAKELGFIREGWVERENGKGSTVWLNLLPTDGENGTTLRKAIEG